MNIDLIQNLLVIAAALSVITCAFIQKTKGLFKSNKLLNVYSFVVNIVLGILFCLTFTEVSWYESLWVGGFSFIGADTLYKSLEGKLKSYTQITANKTVSIPTVNLIETEVE